MTHTPRVATPPLAFAIASLSGLFAFSGGIAEASTSSSWGTQPAWASSPEGTSTAPRKAKKYDSERFGVSPYSPGSNNIAVDLGQVFLMGDLGSKYSDSIGTQIHYTYGVSELFGFDSSIGFSEHSDGQLSMGTLLTGLRTNLAWYDKVVPYLVFGMGFYKPSYELAADKNGQINSISPLLFGVHLGPGVDLELTKQIFFGAAVTFHDVFGDTKIASNNQKIEVGGTFTSFFLHAGFTF